MATAATIFKVELSLADMDNNHYATYPLTVAMHPSENEQRMMVRVIAFALNAHEELQFGGGVSTDHEPDLWRKHMNGTIEQWIDLGQLDEKRARKACGVADEVLVYTYQQGPATQWWASNAKAMNKSGRLKAFHIEGDMTALVARKMNLSLTICEGDISLTDGETVVDIDLKQWQ